MLGVATLSISAWLRYWPFPDGLSTAVIRDASARQRASWNLAWARLSAKGRPQRAQTRAAGSRSTLDIETAPDAHDLMKGNLDLSRPISPQRTYAAYAALRPSQRTQEPVFPAICGRPLRAFRANSVLFRPCKWGEFALLRSL